MLSDVLLLLFQVGSAGFKMSQSSLRAGLPFAYRISLKGRACSDLSLPITEGGLVLIISLRAGLF